MKKRTVSRKMYDMASERSITALSRARKLKTEQCRIENPAKMSTGSGKQGSISQLSQETCPSKMSVQASGGKRSEQASGGKLSEQASTSKFLEQASTSKFLEQASTSKFLEQTSASKTPEQTRTNKLAEKLSIFQLVDRPIARQSTIEKESADKQFERETSKSEQERLIKLKNLRKDNPKLKLLKHIDVGNMFTICHKHPEFRPLITSMFQIHEFVSSNWNRHEQDLLIGIFKKVEAIISEIVFMKSYPDSSDDIEVKFDRLSWYIGEFIDILHVHMDTLHTEKLQYASFVSSSEGRNWLEEREKAEVDDSLINELVKPKTYLSTRIDTELLMRIAHEHPELRPSVKCVLSVDSAMKYLEYEGQIKVFKVLAKVEKFLKRIVQQKYDPDRRIGDLIETTTILIRSINESFTEIMSNLSSQCEKSKKKSIECGTCPSISKLVKNVNVKPQQLRLKRQENPHSDLKGVVAYANHGISRDYLKNLETLFHHLAAKQGAYRHVWLYKTSVNWIEIALQHKEYKSKAHENGGKMEIVRSHILRRLDEYEEVMAGATEFAERFREISFPNAENLSEEFALSGQLESLASEAEDYLTTLDRLIGHFLADLKRYRTRNSSVRKDRNSFLLKQQVFAFDFPLY